MTLNALKEDSELRAGVATSVTIGHRIPRVWITVLRPVLPKSTMCQHLGLHIVPYV